MVFLIQYLIINILLWWISCNRSHNHTLRWFLSLTLNKIAGESFIITKNKNKNILLYVLWVWLVSCIILTIDFGSSGLSYDFDINSKYFSGKRKMFSMLAFLRTMPFNHVSLNNYFSYSDTVLSKPFIEVSRSFIYK